MSEGIVQPVSVYALDSGAVLVTWLSRLPHAPFSIGPSPEASAWTDGVTIEVEGDLVIGVSSAELGEPASAALRAIECSRFVVCQTELERDDISVVPGNVVLGPSLAALEAFDRETAAERPATFATLAGGVAGVVIDDGAHRIAAP